MVFSLWNRLTSFSCRWGTAREVPVQSWDTRIAEVDVTKLPSLSVLSDDILMEVFQYLDVEDIIALRRVNKLYYNLSHHGIIWKNFLKRIGPNAPQLPPSKRNTLQHLTSFDAERMITRTISLQKNWLSEKPHPLLRDSFEVNRLIQSMVVLPGGKYMVASVCNEAKTHYSVMLLTLDHRICGVVPLAETPVETKAYNLQARYMDIDGAPSIVIAYVRRKVVSRYHGSRVDPSIYEPILDNPRKEIDPPVPFQYVCRCLHVRLDTLDALSDPSLVPGSLAFFQFAAEQPPPFRLLATLRSSREFGAVDVGVIEGMPTLAVVKDYETVVFKELSGLGTVSTLYCAREDPYSPYPHTICKLRILPQQSQILVISAITLPEPITEDFDDDLPQGTEDLISLALFDMPDPGDNERYETFPQQSISFRADDVEGIQLTDPSSYDSLPWANPTEGAEHPSINIYYRSEGGKRLNEITLNPTHPKDLRDDARHMPHYWLGNIVTGTHHTITWKRDNFEELGNCRAFVLPGNQRSLIYVTRTDDIEENFSIRGFYSHHALAEETIPYFKAKDDLMQGIMRAPIHWREDVLSQFGMSPDLKDSLKEGVKAIAYDEGTGRVFYAKPKDTHLHIIDFAKAPLQGPNGQRWPLPLADARMNDL